MLQVKTENTFYWYFAENMQIRLILSRINFTIFSSETTDPI
jgi:hypothetical protein